jgi:hypothetical protein
VPVSPVLNNTRDQLDSNEEMGYWDGVKEQGSYYYSYHDGEREYEYYRCRRPDRFDGRRCDRYGPNAWVVDDRDARREWYAWDGSQYDENRSWRSSNGSRGRRSTSLLKAALTAVGVVVGGLGMNHVEKCREDRQKWERERGERW